MMLARTCAPVWVCTLLFLVGCGDGTPKGVIVTGKVVKGGQSLPLKRADVGLGMVEIHLTPVDGTAEDRGMAKAAQDGSFTVLGPGRGVKPGKYKFAVYHRENGPPGDSLDGAFSDENTKIVVDVPAGKLGRTLDLGTIDLDTPPTNLP